MDRSEALALVEKYGSKKAAASAAGIPRSTFADYCAGRYASRGAKPSAPPAAPGGEFVSQADVLASHDVVGKVLEFVRGAVPAGSFLSDDALRRSLGVGYDRWRVVRGSLRLSGYFLETPDKKVLWGRKETVASTQAKLKELV